MSGLTDALLEEIAENSKVEIELLQRLVDQAGGGGGGGGPNSTSYNALGKTFKGLGFVVGVASGIIGGAFSTALGVASSGLRTLTSIGTQLFRAQMLLAETTRDGSGTLSSFYDSLSSLPFGLGLVAQVLSFHTKVLETNLATFQKMSQTGATLGGNLDLVRQSAKGMYLSMDEFANVMQANVGVIGMLGGTVDEGAKNLIRFNTQLIQGNVGRQLLGMGHTIEEVNMMLGSYASIVGGVRDSDFKNQKRMEQSVKSFAVELDLAAQLEGKTRKQKEDELKQAADQAAVQAMLAGMSAENQDKYIQSLADAKSRGQGAVDLLHSQMLGLPPMTEAAQLFYAMNNRAAEAVKQNADMVIDGTTALEARGRIDRNIAIANEATVATYDRMGRTGQALTYSMDATGQAVREMAVSAANAKKLGMETEEKSAKRITESREAIVKAGESEAGAVAQAAGRAKYQGEWLMNMLYGLFKPLEPILLGVVNAFKFVMTTVIPFATDVLNKVMIPLFKDLFGNISFDDIVQPFRDFFKGFIGGDTFGLTEIKNTLLSILSPLVTAIGGFVKSVDWVSVGVNMRSLFDNLVVIGEILGSVIVGAINLAIGAFNLVVSAGTALYRILDYMLTPFGGMAAVIEGPITSAFNWMVSLIQDTIIPWFNSLGGKLSEFGIWIDDSTKVIQGPLKVALDLLTGAIGGVVVWFGYLKLAQIASFALMQIKDKWETIQIIWMMRKELMEKALAFASNLVKVGFVTLLGPVGLAIIAVGVLVGLFKTLYDNGWTFSTVLEALGDNLKRFGLAYTDIWLSIAEKVAGFFGGGEGITAARTKIREEQKALDEKEKARDEKNKKTAEARNATEEPTVESPSALSVPLISNPFEIAGVPETLPNTPSIPAVPKPAATNNSTISAPLPEVPNAQEDADRENNTSRSTGISSVSGSTNDDTKTLNTGIAAMNRILREIADNTKDTGRAVAALGNQFR